MATTAEIAKRYFDALARHDLDAAVALCTGNVREQLELAASAPL